jgi:hypothetical protein
VTQFAAGLSGETRRKLVVPRRGIDTARQQRFVPQVSSFHEETMRYALVTGRRKRRRRAATTDTRIFPFALRCFSSRPPARHRSASGRPLYMTVRGKTPRAPL